MTLEEALEYLNLPRKSSAQLVKKRFQELQEDYLKAISNAPSQHFRDLYSENLEKIEQAYLLMKKEIAGPAVAMAAKPAMQVSSLADSEIQQKIWEIQTVIDTFSTHNDLTGKTLNKASRAEIERYLDQIQQWQQSLKERDKTPVPAVELAEPLVQAAAMGLVAAVEPATEAPSEVLDIPTQPVADQSVPDQPLTEPANPIAEPLSESPAPSASPEDINQAQPPQEAPQLAPELSSQPSATIETTKIDQEPEFTDSATEQPATTSEPTTQGPKTKYTLEQVQQKRDQWVDQIFKDRTTWDRSKSLNRLVGTAILLVFLTGIGGITYMLYPIAMQIAAESDGQNSDYVTAENPTAATKETPAVSIAQIVGDEFFRTGNYLEAIVQYTLAFADEPDNIYLRQRIDSCKLLLSSVGVIDMPEQAEPLPQAREQSTTSPVQPPPENSSNRFRGDENVPPKDFAWKDWAQDQEVNEQVINSARSALLNTKPTYQGDSSLFEEPKTSGDTPMETDSDQIIRSFVDSKPEPLGGWEDFKKFTSRKIRFPQAAYRAKVSGIVLVQFVVSKEGAISDARVVQGIGYGCDQEALRIVKAYKGWTPGILEGQAVNTRAVIPIHFKLAN